MHEYTVVTHDDEEVVGHVVDKVGGNYIVQQGTFRKTKHALPEEFARLDETGERLVITVSKEMVSDSPKVDGEVDEAAVAAHYGLSDTTVDDPAGYDDEQAVRERIDAYEGVEPTERLHESPALLGDRLDDSWVEDGRREPKQ